jgi:hypothetical protein
MRGIHLTQNNMKENWKKRTMEMKDEDRMCVSLVISRGVWLIVVVVNCTTYMIYNGRISV